MPTGQIHESLRYGSGIRDGRPERAFRSLCNLMIIFKKTFCAEYTLPLRRPVRVSNPSPRRRFQFFSATCRNRNHFADFHHQKKLFCRPSAGMMDVTERKRTGENVLQENSGFAAGGRRWLRALPGIQLYRQHLRAGGAPGHGCIVRCRHRLGRHLRSEIRHSFRRGASVVHPAGHRRLISPLRPTPGAHPATISGRSRPPETGQPSWQ